MVGRPIKLDTLWYWLLLAGLFLGSLSTAQAHGPEPSVRPSNTPVMVDTGAPIEAQAGVREPLPSRLVRNGIGLVILGMSFYLVALVVWMAFEYRRAAAMPATLIQELEHRLQHQRFADAYERLLPDRSFLARVLAPGVRRLNQGTPAALRAMELANEQVTLEMESHAGYLGTVAALGPMIGLLGTVYGMIVSFGVIARASDSPQPGDLAAGISTALVSTLEGIAIAVPAIIFAGIFRSRIARLSAEVQTRAEGLLEQFGTPVGGGAPMPPVPATTPTTAATTHPLAAAALSKAAARARGKLP